MENWKEQFDKEFCFTYHEWDRKDWFGLKPEHKGASHNDIKQFIQTEIIEKIFKEVDQTLEGTEIEYPAAKRLHEIKIRWL